MNHFTHKNALTVLFGCGISFNLKWQVFEMLICRISDTYNLWMQVNGIFLLFFNH